MKSNSSWTVGPGNVLKFTGELPPFKHTASGGPDEGTNFHAQQHSEELQDVSGDYACDNCGAASHQYQDCPYSFGANPQ